LTTRLGFWDVLFNVESSGAGGDVVVESGRGVVDVGSGRCSKRTFLFFPSIFLLGSSICSLSVL